MNSLRLLSVFIILLTLSACGKKTSVVKPVRLQSKSAKYLQFKVEENYKDFETMNAKFSARTNFNDEKLNFKGSVKIKKDSIIWLSMTKLGGVEMVRLVLTQDSIKFINKWDKEYFLGTIDKLDQVQNIEMGFMEIQNLLMAKMLNYQPEDKFSSSNDNIYYLLTSKNKGKIKRASTIVEGDSLLGLEVQDKMLQKALSKNGENDFIIKNYYLNPDNFWLARQTINLVDLRQAMDIVYDSYQIVDDYYPFPFEHVIRIVSPEKAGRIDLRYHNIQFNQKSSYPFKISSKYEPIKKRN